jgi:hypothetical protein
VTGLADLGVALTWLGGAGCVAWLVADVRRGCRELRRAGRVALVGPRAVARLLRRGPPDPRAVQPGPILPVRADVDPAALAELVARLDRDARAALPVYRAAWFARRHDPGLGRYGVDYDPPVVPELPRPADEPWSPWLELGPTRRAKPTYRYRDPSRVVRDDPLRSVRRAGRCAHGDDALCRRFGCPDDPRWIGDRR